MDSRTNKILSFLPASIVTVLGSISGLVVFGTSPLGLTIVIGFGFGIFVLTKLVTGEMLKPDLRLMVTRSGKPVAVLNSFRLARLESGELEVVRACAWGEDAQKIPASVVKDLSSDANYWQTIKLPEIDVEIGWITEKQYRVLNSAKSAFAKQITRNRAVRLAQETVKAYKELELVN